MPDTPLPDTLSFDVVFSPPDNARLANLCGPYDAYLKQIERHFGVAIRVRENALRVTGPESAARSATGVLEHLYAQTAREPISAHLVQLQLQEVGAGLDPTREASSEDAGVIQTKRGAIRGRGLAQARYVGNIRTHDINFGIGPAGTGKTFLAVACAAEALQRDQVRRLVLVRPAVEAGERLGFLPGDLTQKIDPYLRPLYDALYDIVGFDQVAKLMERNVIELAPLAYMRGRTLNDSFIILDEAQNTTVEQMKMFLTRIGFNSTAVITGDVTQVDLPRGATSGLIHVIDVLNGVEGISFTFFDARDVVRHPLIQRIVAAYDRHDTGKKEHGSH
jgi:phosphate starvation-inducible PhoH-like protein